MNKREIFSIIMEYIDDDIDSFDSLYDKIGFGNLERLTGGDINELSNRIKKKYKLFFFIVFILLRFILH